jgi:glycosyltransferase involved in cell wall biosynthesis
MLARLGIPSDICSDRPDPSTRREVLSWRRARRLQPDALLIHYSHGSAFYRRAFSRPERKILVYHGITPSGYFRGVSPDHEAASRQGRDDLPQYRERVEIALAHSSFSAGELRESGFRNVSVLPYICWERLYAVEPDRSWADRYRRDGWVNLLSVGRIAPNKCLEDCLFVFDYFQRFVERRSRLFIVGRWDGNEAYLWRLQKLAGRLGVRDVVFTGVVPQPALLGLLDLADAMLCMSEHEGFCVPLVEAMRRGVPVFAYASTAVPETLRGTGVLFTEKRWPVVAEAIGLLLENHQLRQRVIAGERREAAYYSPEAALERLRQCLAAVGLAAGAGAERSRPAPALEEA